MNSDFQIGLIEGYLLAKEAPPELIGAARGLRQPGGFLPHFSVEKITPMPPLSTYSDEIAAKSKTKAKVADWEDEIEKEVSRVEKVRAKVKKPPVDPNAIKTKRPYTMSAAAMDARAKGGAARRANREAREAGQTGNG